MIKDVLLVSALILSIVLIYRMYVVNQKINNLEEKFVVLDNFSQTLFNYISNKEESPLTNEITYSNNESKKIDAPSINAVENEVNNNAEESDSDSESESDDIKETENFESKEILSEMVSQLKESNLVVVDDKKEVEKIEETVEETTEVKEEETKPTEFLTENSVVTQLINESNPVLNTKKKQEDLMKLNMTQLKDLAKSKNIPLFQGRNIKKKNILVQDIMDSN